MIKINLLSPPQKSPQKFFFLIGIFFLIGLIGWLARVSIFHAKKSLRPPLLSTQPAPIKIIQKIGLINNAPSLCDEKNISSQLIRAIPLQQFQWAGSLVQRKIITVFLKNSNGETIAVKKGDKIGIEQATVVAIDVNQITFSLNHHLIIISRNNHA